MLGGSLLALSLLGSNASGDDFVFNTKSLFGIEAGYTYYQTENNNQYTPVDKSYDLANIGLKIGAESENYRIFLNIRNYFIGSGYDRLLTYGGEIQYLFNFSQKANFFMGANVGRLYGKFRAGDEPFKRDFSDFYYGGDLGFNFHINNLDLEVGARYITSKAKDDQYGITYSVDSLITAYTSVIFKFQID